MWNVRLNQDNGENQHNRAATKERPGLGITWFSRPIGITQTLGGHCSQKFSDFNTTMADLLELLLIICGPPKYGCYHSSNELTSSTSFSSTLLFYFQSPSLKIPFQIHFSLNACVVPRGSEAWRTKSLRRQIKRFRIFPLTSRAPKLDICSTLH